LEAVSVNFNHLEIHAPQRVMVRVLRGPELWEGFMRRREFITVMTATAAWPFASLAQQSAQVPRIGFLGNSNPELEANLIGPFRDGLAELGYVEGSTIVTEYRWAAGKYERFPALIAELLALDVALIVTAGTPASLAVKKTAPTMPLVMVAVGDPVGTGLVESLAHPGGNATGLTSVAPELEGERLELLKEAVPDLSHVAVLWNPSNAFMLRTEAEVQAAARVLGLKVLSLGVTSPDELDTALARVIDERPGALNVLADRLFLHNRARIMEFALQNRLPGVHAYRELVEAGGLMSYGPSYADMHRRAAGYVDRILKGAKPADLPVQVPAKFELVLNLSAAQALGLSVPASLLARADEVIE
jgi:putative tryptophan/tyrosine transport system substrate-binding protein